MRMEVKELKKPVLGKYAFVVPEFEECEGLNLGVGIARRGGELKQTLEETPEQYYAEQVERKGLAYKHFVSVQPAMNLDVKVAARGNGDPTIVEPRLVNGYDGFGGVHDNLIWLQKAGKLIYTLHNKIIFESVKERSQGESKLLDSAVRLSCLAVSADNKRLAAGEGDTNAKNGVAYIHLYDISNPDAPRRTSTLANHHSGIQALAFAAKGDVLISMSNYGENRWVAWDVADNGARILADQAMDRDGLTP
jgi:hypothetical protein